MHIKGIVPRITNRFIFEVYTNGVARTQVHNDCTADIFLQSVDGKALRSLLLDSPLFMSNKNRIRSIKPFEDWLPFKTKLLRFPYCI